MSTSYIDIVFEGSSFSPKKLSTLINSNIEVLAEAGEIGLKGRYKGKPMPYGLGLLKVEPLISESMNEALERVIDDLLTKKTTLKKSGVDDITLDLESLSEDDIEISINKGIIKKLSSLDANIEFSKLIESDRRTSTWEDVRYSKIYQNTVKKASSSLSVLNNPLLLKLMEVIEKEGKINIGDLVAKVKQEQSIVSQHLAILRRNDIVSSQRSGKFIYYSVNRRRIFEISRLANSLSQSKPIKKRTASLIKK